MSPFKFECLASNVEHSCQYGDEKEPEHQPHLNRCINSVIEATEGLSFNGKIKSSSNSFQIDLDFDTM